MTVVLLSPPLSTSTFPSWKTVRTGCAISVPVSQAGGKLLALTRYSPRCTGSRLSLDWTPRRLGQGDPAPADRFRQPEKSGERTCPSPQHFLTDASLVSPTWATWHTS